MLKKFLSLAIIMIAMCEATAYGYEPYADPPPIPKTEEKNPSPSPKKKPSPSPKKKPSPSPKKKPSPSPKKKPAATVKVKEDAPKPNTTASDSQTTTKPAYSLKQFHEDMEKSRKERQEREAREAREKERQENKAEVESVSLSLTNWDFDNMTVRLRDSRQPWWEVYNLKLEYDSNKDNIKFKTKRIANPTIIGLRTSVVSDKTLDEKLLTEKVKFTVPPGWELHIDASYVLSFTPDTYESSPYKGEYYNGEYRSGSKVYSIYKSGLIVVIEQLQYLPYVGFLHKASQ